MDVSTPGLNARSGMLRAWVSVASFASVSALCVWFGYYTTFNSWAAWDDEGYVLSTVNVFAHHGGLYTHVYSVFGPFFYEASSTIFTWLPVTLDNGRIVTLIVSLLASVGFGVAIKMFTRNVLAGIVTQVGTFVLLILSFVDESMHPMLFVSLLFAVALIGLALVAQGKWSSGSMVLGATVAALVLTVVNAGAFASIALLFAGLALAPPRRTMRLPRAMAAVLFAGTPFLLIAVAAVAAGHATDSWALKYALAVTLAAGAVAVVTLDRGFQGLVHASDAYHFFLGGAIMGAVIVIIALVSGTQPVDLVRGLFIDPARFSYAGTIPLSVPMWVEVWGIVCLAGSVFYRRYRSRNPAPGLVDGYAHVAVGLLILYCALQEATFLSPKPSPTFTNTFLVALPLVFFGAIPPVEASESERVARVALVALAVLEGLLAFPVAGAQVRWSSLLIVVVGILCVHDGVHHITPGLVAARLRGGRHAVGLSAPIAVLAGLAWLSSVFVGDLSSEMRSYHANTPVTLLGSDLIHLPASQAGPLESLSQAIRAQCSTFVTLPAMDSLYFWTGEGPPTDWFNVWLYTADRPLQQQIVEHVKRVDPSRFCVIENPVSLLSWKRLPQLPLVRLEERVRADDSHPELFGHPYGDQLFVSHGLTP